MFTSIFNVSNRALDNSSSAIQVYRLTVDEEFGAGQVYELEVKIRAVNSLGSGPKSAPLSQLVTIPNDTLVATSPTTSSTCSSPAAACKLLYLRSDA